MEITMQEAADALSVHTDTISRKFGGRMCKLGAGNAIDSETLCDLIHLDHRFLMAFLGNYDAALTNRDLINFGLTRRQIESRSLSCRPVVMFARNRRWSYRRFYPTLEILLEKKDAASRRCAARLGAGTILPSPDTLPPSDWGFKSVLQKEGYRLPYASRTTLKHGPRTALPVLDGLEKQN